MSLMKSCLILQNVNFKAYTVSNLLKETQQGVKINPTPIQIRVKNTYLGEYLRTATYDFYYFYNLSKSLKQEHEYINH